ncbi:hypothetical protein PENTCL1PPCAC_5891, partial [Pristionchus entomophagus]
RHLDIHVLSIFLALSRSHFRILLRTPSFLDLLIPQITATLDGARHLLFPSHHLLHTSHDASVLFA